MTTFWKKWLLMFVIGFVTFWSLSGLIFWTDQKSLSREVSSFLFFLTILGSVVTWFVIGFGFEHHYWVKTWSDAFRSYSNGYWDVEPPRPVLGGFVSGVAGGLFSLFAYIMIVAALM